MVRTHLENRLPWNIIIVPITHTDHPFFFLWTNTDHPVGWSKERQRHAILSTYAWFSKACTRILYITTWRKTTNYARWLRRWDGEQNAYIWTTTGLSFLIRNCPIKLPIIIIRIHTTGYMYPSISSSPLGAQRIYQWDAQTNAYDTCYKK
jgi:hypothetical protein